MPANIRKVVCVLFIATAVILPLVFLSSGFFASASEKVLPGVAVMGADLGGLNKAEGMAKLAEVEKSFRATRVTLRYQNRSWALPLSETGLTFNQEAVMEAALNVGRQGSLLQRWQEKRQPDKTNPSLQPVIQFDREKLSRTIRELAGQITTEPRNATFKVNYDDSLTVVPGQNGLSVDYDALEKDIASVLVNGGKPEVELSLIPVAPARPTSLLESMKVKGLLAGYTTKFDPSKSSRAYNVKTAAQPFDNLFVKPGEQVSFNDVVGPRSTEAGYKNAPVILNNEFVDGIGGGVCQVSTTLYNSVLLANLEVTDRTNHSLPVSYVPIGRDATVTYDAIDFKFRNNTDGYLFIKTTTTDNSLTIKIYGDTAYKRDVSVNTWITREIEPETVYENDPNLPKGKQVVRQEGAKGFSVAAERVVRRNGAVEKREALPSSYYSPMNKVIAVGVGEENAQQVKPPTGVPGSISR